MSSLRGLPGAAGCFIVGVGLCLLGYRLIKSNESKPGESAFVSFVSQRTLGYSGGYGALFLGLLLMFIFAPMFYLSR